MIARFRSTRVEKPWGVCSLPPPFGVADADRVGEIWLDRPDAPGWPLLIKYLFTSARLSIQVHPDDDQACARGLARGKEECWYILDALPGATLGLGTRHPLTALELREAARSGALEALVQWHPVSAGMFVHVPPGTVHAIGAGISLIEVQQNSDVTYRLYDYGRPRALHLDDGAAVARAAPYPVETIRTVDPGRSDLLLDGPHFCVAHLTMGNLQPLDGAEDDVAIVPIEGAFVSGCISIGPGEALAMPAQAVREAQQSGRFLACWAKV
jgi:mannose-6-phosphate isomerase